MAVRVGSYALAACLSVVIAFLVLDLRHASWRIPFSYGGDALFSLMLFKGMIDNGWYLHNEFLGMPWPMDLHDFPLPDTFQFALVKIGTLLAPDAALVENVYFVLTFPLTTLTALYVFRRFGSALLPALLGSLLYAFLPFHLQRGESHLLLSGYYVVPLAVLMILWECHRASDGGPGCRPTWRALLHDRRFLGSVLVCVVTASSGGFYYPFFAAWFLVVVGLLQAVRARRAGPMLVPCVLAAVLFLTLVVNVSPSIGYRLQHGATSTARRPPSAAEEYGLKIAQLVLPVTGHRISALRTLKDRYNRNPLVNENDTSSLGVIGSLGFLFLVGWAVVRIAPGRPSLASDADALVNDLSLLNLAAVLLATIGGLGALFALLVSAQIRGYNRISVYIAFFSLFAVVVSLDRVWRSPRLSRRGRIVVGASIAVLTGLGVLDQSTSRVVPDHAGTRSQYLSDAEFVHRIEATVAPGAMIFQLPFRIFPEAPPSHRLNDYDPFKGYLHSRRLRWSYGAMRGRPSAPWQESVVEKPPAALLETLAVAGFTGLYIDRFGYADDAASLEADVARVLGEKPLVSADGRLAFFDLTPFESRLTATLGVDRLAAKREELLSAVLVTWGRGAFPPDETGDHRSRWCRRTCRAELMNPLPRPRRAMLEVSLAAARDSTVRIESPLLDTSVTIGPTPRAFSWPLVVPSGRHTIQVTSDAGGRDPGLDPRAPVVHVLEFTIRTDE
jgi:hypothetical protein